MKRSLLLVLPLLLSLVAAVAEPSAVTTKAHKAAHNIKISTMLGTGGGCSGTSIGPHALLTATHCVGISDTLTVDGTDAHVESLISDGLDHTIYLLSDIEFTEFADVADHTALEQGQHVFLFGNPGSFHDMYREGYVSGYEGADDVSRFLNVLLLGDLSGPPTQPKHKAPVVTLYDFNGFFGDSGSALFNRDGKIVGVTSYITHNDHSGYSIKFMGGYELRLTAAQLKQAREF